QVLVWGGSSGGPPMNDGAAYDPGTDAWRAIAVAPSGRAAGSTVWTGNRLVVVGGGGSGLHDVGLAYDVAANSWLTLPESGLKSRSAPAVAWTGLTLVEWGGTDCCGGPPPSDGASYTP